MVRDGGKQRMINCYLDTSLMQHVAVSVHDSYRALRKGQVVEGVKALMQRTNVDPLKAVIDEVPWILRF